DFTNKGTVPLKDTIAPSTPVGLPSTEGNNTLDTPPDLPSQPEGNSTLDTPPGLPSQQKGTTQGNITKSMYKSL
ncbi:hypothetical protein Taro_019331, partial [Colocasia esculenta]|nr:hypothetical protein [Colocasia esculenta]